MESQRTPSRGRFLWERIWLSVTVCWLILTVLSLANVRVANTRGPDLDQLCNCHENQGFDFFQTPRGWDNLRNGANIFWTDLSDYGPYATAYFNHPVLAVLVGPWTFPFKPWTAYGLFVTFSVICLLAGGLLLRSNFSSPGLRGLAVMSLMVSMPTYLMLWNAQMHIFVVLSTCMILASLCALLRESPSKFWPVCFQLGVLLGLLSKPMILLAFPVFFCCKETRKLLWIPTVVYVLVSLTFLLIPRLNPLGVNGFHWVNLKQAAASPFGINNLGIPSVWYTSIENAGTYSLPMHLVRSTRVLPEPVLLRLPLLAIVAFSLTLLGTKSRSLRLKLTLITTVMTLMNHPLSHFLAYEYHYAALLPSISVLWWLSQNETKSGVQWLLRLAFVCAASLMLPTPYYFGRHDLSGWLEVCTLFRVLPCLAALLLLLAAGIWLVVAANNEGEWGLQPAWLERTSLLVHGAVLTVCFAGLLAAILATTPRFWFKQLYTWNKRDWTGYALPFMAYLGPELRGDYRAMMLNDLAFWYFEDDLPQALKFQVACLEANPNEVIYWSNLADIWYALGRPQEAISTYQEILKVYPDDKNASEKLKQLQTTGKLADPPTKLHYMGILYCDPPPLQ